MGVASGGDQAFMEEASFLPWPGAQVALAPVWPILTLKMSSENLEWGEVSLRTNPLRAWRAHAKDHPQE